MIPKWANLDPKMGPKIGPRCVQNGSQEEDNMRSNFLSVLGPKLGEIGIEGAGGWRQGRGSLGEEFDLTRSKHALLPR